MDNKYEILKDDGHEIFELRDHVNHTVHRIKALKDFGNVKAGDIGGYIEKPDNLSQKGNCWIYDDATAFGDSILADNAQMHGRSMASGRAIISGHAIVFDRAFITDEAVVHHNAQICGFNRVGGQANIGKDAYITDDLDYLNIIQVGSSNGTFTAYRCKNGIVRCDRGCFNGTLREFEIAVQKKHGTNIYAKQYMAVLEFVKMRLLVQTKPIPVFGLQLSQLKVQESLDKLVK